MVVTKNSFNGIFFLLSILILAAFILGTLKVSEILLATVTLHSSNCSDILL
jgi:hypothetical protein